MTVSEPAKVIKIRGAEPAPKMLVTMTDEDLRAIIRQEIGSSMAIELVDADKLSKTLSVPISWVYEQSRLKQIPTHRVGRYIRFDVHEVLESQKNKK